MSEMPTWEQFMVPVLEVSADGETRQLRTLFADVSAHVGLSEAQQAELLGSGQPRAENRIGWAASYLARVDALDKPSRGRYRITDTGRNLLASHPDGITEGDLKLIAKEGDEWWKPKPTDGSGDEDAVADDDNADSALDPVEQVEKGTARINEAVAAQLLDRFADQNPAFFERAVVDLLLAMGYGGAGGRGQVTKLTHDGGIDGIIDQDVLGLDKVYIQAKRYGPGNSVQQPEVQAFVGAITGKTERGVFITTSRFSQGALDYAASIPTHLILIDGKRLTELMIEYGVGVQTKSTYKVVDVDEDFFT